MVELDVEHVLILVIVIFVIYHLSSCRCSNDGFRVGGMTAPTSPCEDYKNLNDVLKDNKAIPSVTAPERFRNGQLDGLCLIKGKFSANDSSKCKEQNMEFCEFPIVPNLDNAVWDGPNAFSYAVRGGSSYGGGTHVILSGAVLTDTTFVDVLAKGIDLKDADLTNAVFERTDLSDADLRGANLHKTGIHGTNLSNAKLSGADLTGAFIMRDGVGIYSDLSGADLSGADLTGATIDSVKCDSGTIWDNAIVDPLVNKETKIKTPATFECCNIKKDNKGTWHPCTHESDTGHPKCGECP